MVVSAAPAGPVSGGVPVGDRRASRDRAARGARCGDPESPITSIGPPVPARNGWVADGQTTPPRPRRRTCPDRVSRPGRISRPRADRPTRARSGPTPRSSGLVLAHRGATVTRRSGFASGRSKSRPTSTRALSARSRSQAAPATTATRTGSAVEDRHRPQPRDAASASYVTRRTASGPASGAPGGGRKRISGRRVRHLARRGPVTARILRQGGAAPPAPVPQRRGRRDGHPHFALGPKTPRQRCNALMG